MSAQNSSYLLIKAREWYQKEVIENQISKLQKFSVQSLNINPYTAIYLSSLLTNDVTPIGVARALVYMRMLGTSLSTSFGTNLQKFIVKEFDNVTGSVVKGIDIEYIDVIDGRTKYAQIKLGPNTINSADVTTIHNYFKEIRNLARTNTLQLNTNDLVIGILYGTDEELSSSYRRLREEYSYPVYVGAEFWYRITGDKTFYDKLIQVFSSTTSGEIGTDLMEDKIKELSKSSAVLELIKLAKQ